MKVYSVFVNGSCASPLVCVAHVGQGEGGISVYT